MKEKILITGGSGLVGELLTRKLINEGYEVSHLSRKKYSADYPVFTWDVDKKFIEEEAMKDISYIIHLAGAGVADKKWSLSRKLLIRSSRIDAANLLLEKVKERGVKLKAFISASAIGIYGNDEKELKTETSAHSDDFLAEVVKDWEAAAEEFATMGMRVAMLRIGVVLSSKGGALPKIAKPIKYLVGAPLASGNQFMSWVHIEDLCDMFVHAVKSEKVSGPVNAVNPNPVTNREFTRLVAKVLKKPLWFPNVPSFGLKLMLGEMASIVIDGVKVSCQKMLDTGFQPKFETAEQAINDLMSNN